MLASETAVGLPSNIPPPPANLFGPATTPEPNPFLTNSPSAPNPFEAPAPNTTPDPIPAVPFEVAATVPAMSPMSDLAPSTQRMPPSLSNAASNVIMLSADDTHHDHEENGAPSRQDLLQRAAAMPPRMSFESIVFQPTDPILINKQQPRVAERRARFRKMVKVALGACVAFCLVATAATALSSSTGSPSSATKSTTKTAPAAAVVPVEKLELAVVTKANNGQHPGIIAAARPAPAPALKKRR